VCPENRTLVRPVDATLERPVLEEKVDPKIPQGHAAGGQGGRGPAAVVGEDGCVREVQLMNRVDPALDLAVALAVAQWKYRPATLSGRPVAVYLYVTVTFRLNG
jgi:hypothetical protein